MSNFKLHTPEELQKIAEEDFERFKEVSKYYYENDFDFFEEFILPIIEKHKHHEINVQASLHHQDFDESITDISNHVIEIADKTSTVTTPKRKLKSRLYVYGAVSLLLVIITMLLYYYLIYNDSYRQGLKLIKEKNFLGAIEKINEIDSSSNSFFKSREALNFAIASKLFEEKNYREAIQYFRKIDVNSEFYPETKLKMDIFANDPIIIYLKGLNHIYAKEFDEAINELLRVKPNEQNYAQAQSKLMYIRGLLEFNNGNYGNADTYFKGVEKADEFYPDILSKQSTINNFLTQQQDNEYHVSYARNLIQIADDIEDEHQLSINNTWTYFKNTYLPRLINLRSQLNSAYYGATNKSAILTEFKNLILKWVNAYISFAEAINTYGYYSNYSPDNMWANYGYTLNIKRDLGQELHQKVIKKYKEIQSQYRLN